jgi:hypothetical protein
MGLDMKDKKKVCAEIARRYQEAGKKDRGKLLDEYTVTPGYNRGTIWPISCQTGVKPCMSGQGTKR